MPGEARPQGELGRAPGSRVGGEPPAGAGAGRPVAAAGNGPDDAGRDRPAVVAGKGVAGWDAFPLPGEPGRRPLLIGLTGGIGSGKSEVARILAELGAAVVDADAIAREVVEPGEPALADIVAAFGPGVLDAEGRLDRRRLGRLVFGDEEARRRLEAIVHPAIRARTRERMRRLAEAAVHPAIVWDVPLLFEVGAEGLVDEVWVVVAPREARIARLRRRDPDLPVEELERRMAAQIPLEEKAARADVVIDNSGTVDDTRRQVERAWRERLARWRGRAARSREEGGGGTGR